MGDVVAIAHEMKRFSGDTKNGMVPMDARLFNELVRISSKARSGFNAHMEFATDQGIQRLETRFGLSEVPKKKQEPKKKGQEVVDNEGVHQKGTADAA